MIPFLTRSSQLQQVSTSMIHHVFDFFGRMTSQSAVFYFDLIIKRCTLPTEAQQTPGRWTLHERTQTRETFLFGRKTRRSIFQHQFGRFREGYSMLCNVLVFTTNGVPFKQLFSHAMTILGVFNTVFLPKELMITSVTICHIPIAKAVSILQLIPPATPKNSQ